MSDLTSFVSYPIIKATVFKNPISEYPIRRTLNANQRYELLYNICDSVHASCSSDCPVFEINDNSVPNKTNSHAGCDCFKNGKSMHDFILNQIEIKNL